MAETTNKPYTLACLRHSGTHLIQPIMRRLTDKPIYAPKGNDALVCKPSQKVVVFLRDPRNTIVSHTRYKSSIREPAKLDRRIAKLITRRRPGEDTPIEHMTKWAKRWVKWKGALVVRFEVLTNPEFSLSEVERISAYLDGLGDPEDARAYAMGTSVTYTGRHSRWREWFGPEATKAWNENGGPALVRAMGYRNDD